VKLHFLCHVHLDGDILGVMPVVPSVGDEPRSVSPGQLGDLQFRAVKRSSRVIEAARWLQTSLRPQCYKPDSFRDKTS
jgi:hypothetical protein